MIDWFVGYALRKRLVVAMICVFVSIYGYYSWTQLSIEAYPDIADTSSQVVTQAPGMAAEEVEQRITIPLERELSEIHRGIVIPALKQVPGVAEVSNFGGITTQFQLELDPQQLVRFNLSLANVETAINANSSNAGGSVVARGDLGFVIRAIGFVQSLDDLGAIVVPQRNGTPISLPHLARP